MGGKVGKVLPLVAMAVATYFTAGAASAAMTAQQAATTATAMAGSTSSAGLIAAEAKLMADAALVTATQQASLAWLGASAVNGVAGNIANAENQKRMLAVQAERQRVQQLTDKLAITQEEAETQKNLRRVLAARTVAFNARGIDPGVGSPLALQEADHGRAADALDALATRREIVNLGGRLDAAALANRRGSIGDQLFQSVSGSLLDFGQRATGVVSRS